VDIVDKLKAAFRALGRAVALALESLVAIVAILVGPLIRVAYRAKGQSNAEPMLKVTCADCLEILWDGVVLEDTDMTALVGAHYAMSHEHEDDDEYE
jgi:hypothetical protein